jgi:hypothetical protein
MATFMDISVLKHFSVIFSFLIVWIIMYAIFTWGKFPGDNQGLHAVLAFAIAMLVLLYKPAIDIINNAVPWFVVMFIFIVFILISFKIFNTSNDAIFDALKGNRLIVNWLIGISVIILIVSASQVFGQNALVAGTGGGSTTLTNSTGSTGSENFNQNVTATFFHPKVLGLIAILLIGAFTINFLAAGGPMK